MAKSNNRRSAATARVTARQGRRWEELRAAALDVFYEKGYGATRIQDIADRFGILKGSLYHYIDSKDDLLVDILHDIHESNRAAFEAISAGTGTPLERIRAWIVAHIEHNIRQLKAMTVYIRDGASLSNEARARIDAQRHEFEQLLRDLIDAGRADGTIRSDVDAKLASLVILGALNSVQNWYHMGGERSPAEVAVFYADVLIDGLAGRS